MLAWLNCFWVLLGFLGFLWFYLVLIVCVVGLGFITLYWVLLGFNERVLPDFGMIELFLGFTVFFSFLFFYSVFIVLVFIVLGFITLYWVLLGFTGYYPRFYLLNFQSFDFLFWFIASFLVF